MVYQRYIAHYLLIVLLLCISLLISGCSSSKRGHPRNTLNEINLAFKKKYNIDHGYLIALYGLQYDRSIENKSITTPYSKEFVKILNNRKCKTAFLHNTRYDVFKIYANATESYNKTYKLLHKLDHKYKFLSHYTTRLPTKLEHVKSSNCIYYLAKIDQVASMVPIMAPQYLPKITSEYGMRKDPYSKKSKFHKGLDLVDMKVPNIYSAADGKVLSIKYDKCYGKMIEIIHAANFITRYAHLNQILVTNGAKVLRGQAIGIQGKTGKATSEHLHFEILLRNKNRNPKDFIQ